MAIIFTLPSFVEEKGSLTVLDNIQDVLPFVVKRVFFIHAATDAVRGGHRHHHTKQAVICLRGSCVVHNNNGKKEEDFVMDSPDKCLFLDTEDWHAMHSFTPDSMLLVFASHTFDPADYIYEPYSENELVNDTLRRSL